MIFQCFVSFRFSSYFKDTMFVCECVRYHVLIERETVSALPPPSSVGRSMEKANQSCRARKTKA